MKNSAKSKTNKELYTIQDYEILHQHVLNYQAGMESAAEQIIKSFHEYIYKYIVFLKYGQYKLEDPCIRRFISLYTSSADVRKRESQYKHRSFVRNGIRETADYIQQLFCRMEEEDLYQITVLALLQMAKKYKDYDRPSFHNYVDKCFHFELYRAFSPYVNDPVDRRYSSNLELNDDLYIQTAKVDSRSDQEFDRVLNSVEHEQLLLHSDDFILNEAGITPYDDESLNLNWVNGITCTGVFKNLTPFERKIIYLSFHAKMQDNEIAQLYGMCRATINRKKQIALAKLRAETAS